MRIATQIGLWMVVLALAASGVAWGQGQFTTAVAPGRVEKLVNPGTGVTDVITFTNQGDVPVSVSVSLVDFDVSEAGEVIELPPGTEARSVAPFFRISPLKTLVGPKEQFTFRYEVQTPEQFDQLRAFVYFESVPVVPDRAEKQVLFATAMGIPFYVENRKAERGALTVHLVSWQRTDDDPQYLQVTLAATNDGERNIRPGGFLTVRSDDDAFSETFDVNPAGEVVLPGHTRQLQFRFGPVPEDRLSLKFRLDTSLRTHHQSEHVIPRVGS